MAVIKLEQLREKELHNARGRSRWNDWSNRNGISSCENSGYISEKDGIVERKKQASLGEFDLVSVFVESFTLILVISQRQKFRRTLRFVSLVMANEWSTDVMTHRIGPTLGPGHQNTLWSGSGIPDLISSDPHNAAPQSLYRAHAQAVSARHIYDVIL